MPSGKQGPKTAVPEGTQGGLVRGFLVAWIAAVVLVGACIADEGEPGTVTPEETATTDGLRRGLFAEYLFNGDTKDSGGSGRNATCEGAAATFTADRHGRADQAIELGGGGGIDVGEGFKYGTFTVSMWLKPATTQVKWANIIDNNHGKGINWVAQQNEAQDNSYHFGVGRRKDDGAVVHFRLTPGRWQHLALVKTTREVLVYVDGEVVGKTATISKVNYANPPHLRLGRFAGGGRLWRGAMDDVAIYSRPLTEVEIRALSEPGDRMPVVEAGGTKPVVHREDAPDLSGAWLVTNGVVIDVSQVGSTISWTDQDDGFTYATEAEWDGATFRGVLARTSKRSGCSTDLSVQLTPKPDGAVTLETKALDDKCGLRIGFSETFTLTRISPEERAARVAAAAAEKPEPGVVTIGVDLRGSPEESARAWDAAMNAAVTAAATGVPVETLMAEPAGAELLAAKKRLYAGRIGPAVPAADALTGPNGLLRYALTSRKRPPDEYTTAQTRFQERIVEPYLRKDDVQFAKAARELEKWHLDVLDELVSKSEWGRGDCGDGTTYGALLLRAYAIRCAEK